MIFKYTIGSFAVTLTSAMETLQDYHLSVFVSLYCLHLLISFVFMARPVSKKHTVSGRGPVTLRNWARAQRDLTFTSF